MREHDAGVTPENSPPPQTPEDRWNTALHEAGHAVACMECGYKIKSLSIIPYEVPGGWFLGSFQAEGRPNRNELWNCSLEAAEQFFMSMFAGTMAEQLFSPHPCLKAWSHASAAPHADVAYCRAWMEHRAPGNMEEYVAHIKARTEALLQPRRWKVEAIARALLRAKTLDHDAIISASVIALICRGSAK